MLSKLFKPLREMSRTSSLLLNPKRHQPVLMSVRCMFDVPPSQYDIPFSNKLRIGYAMRVYWETIPLFLTTAFALGVLFGAIVWACQNKVEIVFTTHSRANISRTMDLRNPTVHKMMTINQRYEPWPEMQDVLDKMRTAEIRALACAQSYSRA